MSLNRYARRIDANQDAVISALKAAGASVLVLSKPLDLLVGINGRLALFEVKDGNKPQSQQRITKAQQLFLKDWANYPICVVDGPEAALRMLEVLRVSTYSKPKKYSDNREKGETNGEDFG